MTAFTRIGSAIWDWEPWTALDPAPRILWLALYTSGYGRRCVPGLWHGGISTMAEAARMPPDIVISSLDQILERGLVEFDQDKRVLRLCELPDAGEFPSNGNCIRGWWTKFGTIPACPVRDAHVRTIRWILDTGAERAGKALSPHHVEAWEATFARVQIPPPRRRGVQRLADSDTGTSVQPSLFNRSGNSSSYPQEDLHRESGPSDASSLPEKQEMKESGYLGTVPGTVPVTHRIPDPGSRIPDSSSFPERGIGGGHESGMRPALSLVPPFTVDEVYAALARGPWNRVYDDACRAAVETRIPSWAGARVRLEDFEMVGEYNRTAPRTFDARQLAAMDVPSEIARIRRELADRQDRQAMLNAARAIGSIPG